MSKGKKGSAAREPKQQENKTVKKTSDKKAPASKKIGSLTKVALLFCAAFLIHTVLNISVNDAPKVVIDEGLYTNIARSLAWDGEVAFRAQPVNFPYLLYSFLLVPVYWLNRLTGGDVYRFVQVFNTLLVSSSVFPVFLFARDFTKDDSKAFTAAVLVSLMPDMLMGGYEMTECLIWPLCFWMVFFCYRFYAERRLSDGLLAAVFAGLMFACKPGAVAMGGVLLLVFVILAVRDREKIVNALLPLAMLGAIIAGVYLVYLLLYHGDKSLLGLYEKQTSEWSSADALVAIEAFFLQSFLFIFACGGFFCIFPYTHLKEYEPEKRRFVLAAAAGVLAAIAGTAVFVVPYKWTGELGRLPLHMRYCAMFVPLMYVFTSDLSRSRGTSKAYAAAWVAFIALSIFPGARAGFVKGKTGTIDSLALNAFASSRNLNGNVTGWILTVLVIVFSLLFLIDSFRKNSAAGKKNSETFAAANVFFFLFILFNSVCAHVNANIYIDPTIPRDAQEVNRIVGSERCLGITQRYYDDIYSYWLDSRLNVPMQQVTIDQMFVQMEETDGRYSPFVPVEQAPNVNNHETTDTDTLVLGKTIAEHLELSESVLSVQRTQNGHFTVVKIDPSSSWVDSMLFGMDDNSLYPGTPAYLHIFDKDRNADGTLTVSVSASGSGTLTIGGETIALDQQRQSYTVTVPFAERVPVSAEGGTVQIYGYSTQKASA